MVGIFMIQIYNENCFTGLDKLPDKSVDCIFTSPPYWNQRDYGKEGEIYGGSQDCPHEWEEEKVKGVHGGLNEKVAIKGVENFMDVPDRSAKRCVRCGALFTEHGREPNPFDWLKTELAIFEKCKRVLKDEGCLFVNLGDKRAGSGGSGGDYNKEGLREGQPKVNSISGLLPTIKDKSLIGLPWRFLIGMIDAGWICRNIIIWEKPNGFPQSAKDRFTDNWEPIFFFTKRGDYYFKQQFEELQCPNAKNIKFGGTKYENTESTPATYSGNVYDATSMGNGKNMRSVWNIPTEAHNYGHFACFPIELAYRIIDCAVPPQGTIMDIFGGSGTVGIGAKHKNRNAILFEVNPEYIKIIEERLKTEAPEVGGACDL
jgi:DNA modification methylase